MAGPQAGPQAGGSGTSQQLPAHLKLTAGVADWSGNLLGSRGRAWQRYDSWVWPPPGADDGPAAASTREGHHVAASADVLYFSGTLPLVIGVPSWAGAAEGATAEALAVWPAVVAIQRRLMETTNGTAHVVGCALPTR